MIGSCKRAEKIFFLLVFVLLGISANAQKNDYIWLQGYSSWGYDTNFHYWFGISRFDFNYTPRQINYDSLGMNFYRTNTSYCDSNGNLMFYTNGIYIANSLDEKIENSDSLNTGVYINEWDPELQDIGYSMPQGIIALPSPTVASEYYLLHSYLDTFWNWSLFPKRIYVTLLDISANVGHGRVLSKNQTLIEDTIGLDLTAIRHGNGRDWWLLVQERNTNCYYRILIDANGVNVLPDLTCGGLSIGYSNIGASCFSPNGLKYVYLSVYGGVNIFGFDRCTGTLSNPLYIPIPEFADSVWIGNGVSISPNSRFLYVGATKYVFQYDLWAADIAASKDTVAIYDGYQAPFGSYFDAMQLAPDGKIYESCGNSEWVRHVIEYPDRKGDSCMFIQHGIQLPSFCGNVPNFPNYRLGALSGSACDTLTDIRQQTQDERRIQVYPNPASEYVVVDYGYNDWNKGDIELEITNALGQVVYAQELPRYSGFQKIDVSELASGVYMVVIKRNNAYVANAKFAKQ